MVSGWTFNTICIISICNCCNLPVEEIREYHCSYPIIKVNIAGAREPVQQCVPAYTVGVAHIKLFLYWHFFQISVYFWLVLRVSKVIFAFFCSEEEILLVGASLYPGIPTWNVSMIQLSVMSCGRNQSEEKTSKEMWWKLSLARSDCSLQTTSFQWHFCL